MNYLTKSYPIPTHPTWNIVDSSKLETLMTCLRKYFYEYILGWRSIDPNLHLVFGKAWHLAMQHLKTSSYSVENVEKAFQLFSKEYRKSYSPEWDLVNHPKTPEKARNALLQYTGEYNDDLEKFTVIATEKSGSVKVGEEHEICYRMDTIIEDYDGVGSLEHKTTGWEIDQNYREKWLLMPQPGVYNHVLHWEYGGEKSINGVSINAAFFKKVKNNSKAEEFEFERIPVFKSLEQMRKDLKTVNWWLGLLDEEMKKLSRSKKEDDVLECFGMNPTRCFDFRKKCLYHDFCLSWLNPLRRIEDKPLNLKVEFWNPLEEGE